MTASFRTLPALLMAILSGCASVPSHSTPPTTPERIAMAPSALTATAAAATAEADEHAHHHMEGHAPIVIPEGALFTEADVHFMQGMIAHHAQAIHMTRMAESAGGSARVLKLAQKIDLSQAGEIALMQNWLLDNGQFAPDTSSWRTMQMAGMLTIAELDELADARGVAFDRMFLTLMIRHHEGALQMVAELLASPRAAQDVDVNVLANEVETTQTVEIGLMWQMLADLD
jgi:uncharacterized protein (DUF305 family)